MAIPAANRVEAAVDAARRAVATIIHGPATAAEVLHRSNNVVARFGDVVAKVSTDFDLARRDVAVATWASRKDGPAVAPMAGVLFDGDLAVSLWPYLARRAVGDELAAAAALVRLHSALSDLPTSLPPLSARFGAVAELLADPDATSALADRDRALLMAAVETVVPFGRGEARLHGEPHEGNRLEAAGRVVLIDFEAAAVGPVEWDLAYLADGVVARLWPDHDRELRARLKLGVSACVAAACWRHVTARPRDAAMRWHAEHHLALVRSAIG